MTMIQATPNGADAKVRRLITRVLVANRGEIACRVFRTCAAMGISTVAVFSDPDADAPHVHAADAAVRLPGAASAQTYLRGDQVIAAAQAAGADAIHPGYGFLSENAEFAQAVIDAGIIWIGPAPQAIAAMGSKVNAKKLMADAGVPVLGNIDPTEVSADDLPLLIKASAGGGGRGMRIVREIAEFSDQVSGAAREAESAFGDSTVFCEPYVERGHHIEVQIMADVHGTIWAVGERECSIQRRHQKVIEEAPAPLVERIGGDLRARLYDAARAAAAAIGYTGAGTVEFLADDSGRFYFLETNTRLQVEHPVTELTTGTDLVAWQLRVAMGEHLDAQPPAASGHAIEVRLYAEDPAENWQPQSGTVHRFDLPAGAAFGNLGHPGIRVDSGITDGSEISAHYDPMLAKVISWAPTRTQSAALLAGALSRARIHGPMTNRDMLVNTVRHPLFLAGETDTSFIDTVGLDVLSTPLAGEAEVRAAAVAAALSDAVSARSAATVQRGLPIGWRNLPSSYATKGYTDGADRDIDVRYRFARNAIELPDDPDIEASRVAADEVSVVRAGVQRTLRISRYDDVVVIDGPDWSVSLRRRPRFIDPATMQRAGSLLAPMPGSVIRVAVAEGDRVTAGQPLIWLEAMKMEHTVSAPADGVVSTLSVRAGQQLTPGDVLAVISDADESAIEQSTPDQPHTNTSVSEEDNVR